MPSITNKPFEYCGSLSELTLTRLHLAKLTEQSLLGLGSLKKLDMSYNKFVEFPDNVFQWLGSLLEFNLSFNFLNNDLAMTGIIDAFPQLEVLKLAGKSLTVRQNNNEKSELIRVFQEISTRTYRLLCRSPVSVRLTFLEIEFLAGPRASLTDLNCSIQSTCMAIVLNGSTHKFSRR